MARFHDLHLERAEIIVSSPKGQRQWASGQEIAPIMPGIEHNLREYLEIREGKLRELGLDPIEVEQLFPYLTRNGKIGYWNENEWRKLTYEVARVTGIRFRWKDLRPTFAQLAKDHGAPIEAISKCLRHTSTSTIEQYYARIWSETAFSQVRQVWEAPVESKNPICNL